MDITIQFWDTTMLLLLFLLLLLLLIWNIVFHIKQLYVNMFGLCYIQKISAA